MPDLEEYFDPKVGAAVLITAALLSPPGRRWLRRGAVYGLAGLMMAKDTAVGFSRGVGRGVKDAAASASTGVQHIREGSSDPGTPNQA